MNANGQLKDANDIDFFYSPSSKKPLKKQKTNDDGDMDSDDREYQPPKKNNALEKEAPDAIFDSDGEEMVDETEEGMRIVSALCVKLPSD